MDSKRNKARSTDRGCSNRVGSDFLDELLERVLALVTSRKDRSSVSLVCKEWYDAERWSRRSVFIGNCYSVSPEIVTRRFRNIRSVTLKGKPRFSDFNFVPRNWGADVKCWLEVFAAEYPGLEELRLKRMTVSDESLEFLAVNFGGFKALSLLRCDGFSTDGIAAIATYSKNLVELDIQENDIDDKSGGWLSCFPETFTSLEILNFARLNSDVNFEALERLVCRCKSFKVLKVNRSIALDQLQRLLVHAPQLMELGTGSFSQAFTPGQLSQLERAFSNCKNLHTLSGLWKAKALYLPALYPACANITFLNLSYASLQSWEFAKLVAHCPRLRRLWVLDTVEDKGLEAVGSNCPLLEELRVFPSDPYGDEIIHEVTESGFVAVSYGCRRLRYVLYFCQKMTNAAVATVVKNCPDFTHFRLCIMCPRQPDHLTDEPMDEAFGAVVKTCTKLQRLGVSGLLTNRTFTYIGEYAKNLETLSVAFAETFTYIAEYYDKNLETLSEAFARKNDWGMKCVMNGCPKLKKLEIRDCPSGNAVFFSGLEKYESMRSLWMSACNVTMNACRLLASEKPRLNVEVIKDFGDDGSGPADRVYVYRSVAGPRRDAPPFVVTF